MPVNVVVLIAVLVVATVAGFGLRRYNGHFRGAAPGASNAGTEADSGPGERVTAVDIAGELGDRATLLQFSSAFCAPCRATRRVLGEVAELVPGVRHVEIDAEHQLGLVRRLGVMRTPTTFVLDPAGVILTRASGQPRKVDVIAALGRVGEAGRPAE